MPECGPYYVKLIAVAKLQISFALCPGLLLNCISRSPVTSVQKDGL